VAWRGKGAAGGAGRAVYRTAPVRGLGDPACQFRASVEVITLDPGDLTSVHRFAEALGSRFAAVGLLVSNAAVAGPALRTAKFIPRIFPIMGTAR